MGEWTSVTLSNSASKSWWTQASASGKRAAGIVLKCEYRINGKNMEYRFLAKDDKRSNTLDMLVPYTGGETQTKTVAANTETEFFFIAAVADLKANENYREETQDVQCQIKFNWWAADGTKQAGKRGPRFYVPVLNAEGGAMFRCMENGVLIECEADGIEAAYVMENGELVEVGV